jgi:hypothetical protein
MASNSSNGINERIKRYQKYIGREAIYADINNTK